MSNGQEFIKNYNQGSKYAHVFVTDIETIDALKRLTKETVHFISKQKREPKWLLDWRLKAFDRLQSMQEPDLQKPKYPKINYQDLYYYSV
jgi:Fe-S cluster assembly protein SufB